MSKVYTVLGKSQDFVRVRLKAAATILDSSVMGPDIGDPDGDGGKNDRHHDHLQYPHKRLRHDVADIKHVRRHRLLRSHSIENYAQHDTADGSEKDLEVEGKFLDRHY